MKRSILFGLWMFVCVWGAQAQLQVVTSSIGEDSLGVPIDATLTLTFSAPIDTAHTIVRADSSTTFLRLAVSPLEAFSMGEMTVSDDSMTVHIPLILEDDQPYVVGVMEAYGADGSLLEPFIVRFTTADSLSGATLSGTVAFEDGSDPTNTIVVLLKKPEVTSDILHAPLRAFATATLVTDDTGAYTLPFVRDGEYILIAIKDLNQDSRFRLIDGDGFGYYHPVNRLPEILHVTNGDTITDLDFSLETRTFEATTTEASRDKAKNTAALFLFSFVRDIQLLSVVSVDSVSEAGTSRLWNYTYYAPHKDKSILLGYSGETLLYVFSVDVEVSRLKELPDAWISSADALTAAGLGGGNDFRSNHEQTAIFAGAFGGLVDEFFIEKPVWLVEYVDITTKESLALLVDAETAAVINVEVLTAQEAVDATVDDALAWAADARLVGLEAVGRNNHPGAFATWIVEYRSDASETMQAMVVTGTGSILTSTTWSDSLTLPRPTIEEGWIDSPEVLGMSERFASFSEHHLDVLLTMRLHPDVQTFPADTTLRWKLGFVGTRFRTGRFEGGREQRDAFTGAVYEAPAYLAFEGSEAAAAEATTWQADATLYRISSLGLHTVDEGGLSSAWAYYYFSEAASRFLVVYVAGAEIGTFELPVDVVHALPAEALPDLSTVMSSEAAIQVADANGGAEYREESPLGLVTASLSNMQIRGDSAQVRWNIHYALSPLRQKRISLDALTGEVLGERTRTTERSAYQVALFAARTWADDAVLRYAHADSMGEDGTVAVWLFGFHSPHKNRALMVEIVDGANVNKQYEARALPVRFSNTGDLRDWLESSIAMARADSALGALLRLQNRLSHVKAELTYTTPPGQAGKGRTDAETWVITYHTTDGTEELVYVGDETIVTGIEETGTMPQSYMLSQNYPNPFNPTTTILYSLPSASHVTLSIYNILGQRVAVLVDAQQTSNTYRVHWEADDLASGVYFYRLEARSLSDNPSHFVQTRQMLLVK